MSRIIKTSVSFTMDIDELEEFLGREFDDDEAEQYALETFLEDIDTFVINNDLGDIVEVEWA